VSTETADITTMDDAELTSLYDDLLDQGRDADIDLLDEIEDRTAAIDEERERRAKEAKAKAKKAEPEKAKAPSTIADQIADLKAQLAKAEELAAEAVVPRKPQAATVKQIGDTIAQVEYAGDDDWKAGQLTVLEVAGLKQEIADLELRLPFADKSDDALLTEAEEIEQRTIELDAEVKAFDKQLAETSIEDTSLRAQRIRREHAAAHAALTPLLNELDTRRRGNQMAAFLEDAAARKSLALRQDALREWTAERDRLESEFNKAAKGLSGSSAKYMDVGPLTEAIKHVDEIEALIASGTPPDESEIERAREWFQNFQTEHRSGRGFEIEV
jgi:Skp family chaperone for outer membrane proteins